MKLTPEDLQRVEDKKVANILRKIYTEKRTPTAREDAILHRAGVQASGIPAPLTGYVGTWDDLAAALGVSRRAIQEWRKDPRYAAHCPPDRADGRKEVAAWLSFMIHHGLKRADEDVAAIPREGDDEEAAGCTMPPPIGGTQADWKTANLALDHRRKLTEVETVEGTLLVAAELEVPLGAAFAAMQSKLTQFPDTAARRVKGLRDEAECRDALRDEIDAVLADLQGAHYTAADAVTAAVASLPFDPETEALCKKLLFDGADRAALLDLAGAIASDALRQLGRRVIAHAQREQEIPDLSIADAVTGQVSVEAAVTEAARRNAVPRCPPEAAAPAPTTTTNDAAEKKVPKKKKRKARPKPTPPPGEIEGAIHAPPRKKKRR